MPAPVYDLTDPKKASPRFDEDGRTICWYVGDTFTLSYSITLSDEAGTPFTTGLDFTATTGNADMVFDFYNKKKVKVHTVTFGKNGISGTQTGQTAVYVFNLNFDKTASDLFDVGDYTYCITYKKDDAVDTVFGRGTIKVESCH